MAPKKKQGKERLDKYYHLAKSQGYRARSAFKLIQLNKKYNFLEKARVCIDLCAAPGGWLQVASKYMPVSSIIVGVDLAAIKPIPRVITHVEDITTDKCRSTLRKDLKDWKADVVLHDGAPNVGKAWLQDAFSQSELTLSALKLAVEFLGKGGTFVTKVFRSQDYNSLLWVFNQLFRKVEATKPPSSRNVSAEIFVVCRDFLAPKKLDPKYLDPKYVFKELDVTPDSAQLHKTSLNDLINPEKASKKRHRGGYEDNDYTLHRKASVLDFLGCEKEAEAIIMLAKCHQFTWEPSMEKKVVPQKEKEEDEDAVVEDHDAAMEKDSEETYRKMLTVARKHPATTEETVSCLSDLKVLGRKDYKELLKWRQKLRPILFPTEKKAEDGQHVQENEHAADKMSVDAKQESTDVTVDGETLMDKLDSMANTALIAEKRQKRKRLERLAKDRRRMQLNMVAPTDIGVEAGGELLGEDFDFDESGETSASKNSLLELRAAAKKIHVPLEAEMDEEAELSYSEDELTDLESANGDQNDGEYLEGVSDGDDDGGKENQDPEYAEEMEEMYDDYLQRRMARNPKEKVKHIRAQEKEFTGADSERDSGDEGSDVGSLVGGQRREGFSESDGDESDFLSEEEEVEIESAAAPVKKDANAKTADLWFSRPEFQDLDGMDLDEKEEDDDAMQFDQDKDAAVAVKKKNAGKTKAQPATFFDVSDEDQSEDDREERAAQEKAKAAASEVFSTAEAVTLAISMVQDGRRGARDVLDTYGYNRNSFAEDPDSLPTWFVHDEAKHRRLQLPVTKEAVERIRQKQKELDARPIKKVLEAKARKKYKAVKKLEKLRKKMNTLFEDGNEGTDYDPEMSAKLGQISKTMRNAMKKAKTAGQKKVQVVPARGSNRGKQGRPNGVQGRYKMVDKRMKKEVRAQKRSEKKGGARKGKK